MLLSGLGFFVILIGFIAAPFAGGLIAEAVRWGVQRRRSRYLARIVVGCLVISVLPFILLMLFSGNFFGLIMPGMLIVLGSGAIMARLR